MGIDFGREDQLNFNPSFFSFEELVLIGAFASYSIGTLFAWWYLPRFEPDFVKGFWEADGLLAVFGVLLTPIISICMASERVALATWERMRRRPSTR